MKAKLLTVYLPSHLSPLTMAQKSLQSGYHSTCGSELSAPGEGDGETVWLWSHMSLEFKSFTSYRALASSVVSYDAVDSCKLRTGIEPTPFPQG